MRIESNLILKGILKLLNVAEVSRFPFQLVIDSTGTVKKFANTTALPVYQIADIYSTYYGNINVSSFIPNEVGSYKFRISLEFGDVSNSDYRLAAQRIVDFSLIVYNDGTATLSHTNSQLHVISHSGHIVKLTSPITLYQVSLNDIKIEPIITSKKLYLKISNNITSPAIGSMKCRYNVEFKRFTWTTGGGDETSE